MMVGIWAWSKVDYRELWDQYIENALIETLDVSGLSMKNTLWLSVWQGSFLQTNHCVAASASQIETCLFSWKKIYYN